MGQEGEKSSQDILSIPLRMKHWRKNTTSRGGGLAFNSFEDETTEDQEEGIREMSFQFL